MLAPAGDRPLQIGQLVSPWCYSLNNNSTSVFTHFNHLIEFKMCCLHITEAGSRTTAPVPHFIIVTLICLSPFLSMALLCQLVSHVLTMEIHPVVFCQIGGSKGIVTKLKREAGLCFRFPVITV